MNQSTLTLLAVATLVGTAPTHAAQAAPGDPEPLCRQLAGELAAVGVPVDLSKLTIEVLPLEAFTADAADLDLRFRTEGYYEAQLMVREALGKEPGTKPSRLRMEDVERRVAATPVHYHFGRNALVFLEGTLPAVGEPMLAVELTVAWRDQQQDLDAALADADLHFEDRMVRAAMIYGEGEAAARRMLAARPGEDGYVSEADVEAELHARAADVLDERLRSEGRKFCERRLDQATESDPIGHFWSALPVSTEQLLHERKWRDDTPEALVLPPWPEKIEHAKLLHEDVIGELGIYAILVEGGVPRAKAFELSVGWDGDIVQVWSIDGKNTLIAWRTVWDRPRDAQQFSRIWGLRSLGEVRMGGRRVDWVFAQEAGPFKPLLHSLENNKPKLTERDRDGIATEEIEEEYRRENTLMAYVKDGIWMHPRYGLALPVPIGWYEDIERGTPFIARTGSGPGYHDSFRVGARPNRAQQTVEQLLEQNKAALEQQEERQGKVFEVREIDGKPVAYMRYEGRDGAHEVVYTSLLYLQGDKQVAITIAIEKVRWESLEPVVDRCVDGIELRSVPPLGQ